MMDVGTIELQTHDDLHQLRLEAINKLQDGSGYFCRLVVQSRGFCCNHQFFFDDEFLPTFIAELESMDRGQPGGALLKGTWETDELRLEMNPRGHVVVKGEVTEQSELSQQLRFALRTDQTVLGQFVNDLWRVHLA